MPTFTWQPDFSADLTERPLASAIKFGDGYEQRTQFGINPIAEVWSLLFDLRTIAERDAIRAFLKAEKGVTTFDWTSPTGAAGKWLCREWKSTPAAYNVNSVTLIFEQQFEVGGVPAPVANFTGTPLSGNAPLSVSFTDTSTNSPTSWAWTFGDGGTSTAQNPTHNYTVPGTYTVTLTATNAGGSDSETKTSYVVAAFDPASLFTGGYIGGWYDESDISTLFQNAAGYNAVSASGNPLGLNLDKSLGLALGSVTTAAGWTNAGGTWDSLTDLGSGAFTATKSSAGGTDVANSTNTVPLVVGEVWEVTLEVASSTLLNYTVGLYVTTNSRVVSSTGSLSGTGTKKAYLIVNSASGVNGALGLVTGQLGTIQVTSMSIRKLSGIPVYQSTSAQIPQYNDTGGLKSKLFDGVDDNMLAISGGGSTTAFCFMACVKITQAGVRQTLFSDAGTNTGYKVELNTSNQLVLSAGNGTSYTTVTTANTFASGDTVSIEAYDDGTNIGVRLNNGTLVTAARPTVTAGTTGFTIGKDNGAASGYFKGNMYGEIYTRNKANTPTERADAITWLRAKGGI